MDMSLTKLQEMVKDWEFWCAESMGSQRVGHDWFDAAAAAAVAAADN